MPEPPLPGRLERLAADLAAARLGRGALVGAGRLAGLGREEAAAVQAAALARLGRARLAKVSVTGEGVRAALVPDAEVTASGGTLALRGGVLLGLEIEVAAVLRAPLTPELAAGGEAAVLGAVDHFLLGIELIGTRIDDPAGAGPFGTLADGMIGAGYVTGRRRWARPPPIDGLPVAAEVDGRRTALGPARHPFGGVLAPLAAWARRPPPHIGRLAAGTTVTTGALAPLLEVPPRAHVVLRLGDHEAVEVRLAGPQGLG